MPRVRGRRRLSIVIATIGTTIGTTGALLATAACGGSTAGHQSGPSRPAGSASAASGAPLAKSFPDAPTTAGRCTLTDQLVPSCGMLWGLVAEPHTLARVQDVEQKVGRSFNLVYRFHDLNDRIPEPMERQAVASGYLLHITINATDYQTHKNVPYQDVTDGKYDDNLRRQARGIASLKVPVFLTFQHEANLLTRKGEGSPQQYVQAWRHVHDLFVRAGATNAVWTWVMGGNPSRASASGPLWPGNDYVQWIGWDVYNRAGCSAGKSNPNGSKDFEQSMLPFYNWLIEDGPKAGIDLSKVNLMISEAGTAVFPSDPGVTASWYQKIPQTLAKYPRIKAVTLWDNRGTVCNFTFDQVPQVNAGVRSAGSQIPAVAVPKVKTGN